MNKLIVVFLFMFLVINPSKCYTWDPLDIGKNIQRLKAMLNEAIEKIFAGMGDLIEKAKSAVNSVLDKLFDEKLTNLLNKIQEMIDKNMKQIDTYIQELIDKVFDQVRALVEQISTRVKEIIAETADQIKNKIIDEFYSKAGELVDGVNKDILNVLKKIDDGIYHVYCSERAAADQIINSIVTKLPWYNPISDKCRDQIDKKFQGHNLKWKFFYSYSQNELYEYKKCLHLIDMDPMTTPVSSLILALRDVELLAGDMRCVSVSLRAEKSVSYYAQEMAECVGMIDLLSPHDGSNREEFSSKFPKYTFKMLR